MLHITGYGLTGPKSERPGFGTLGEAMSGFANITGQADGPPTLPPFMLADGVASLNAAYAVMMALYHRDVHGASGQLIDINLIDPLARLLEQTLLGYDQLGAGADQGGQPLGHLGAAQHLPHRRRPLAGDVGQLTAAGAAGVSRDRARRPGRRRRLLRPAAPAGAGPRGGPGGRRLGGHQDAGRGDGDSSTPPRWPPRRSTTSPIWSPTSSWRIARSSSKSATTNSVR